MKLAAVALATLTTLVLTPAAASAAAPVTVTHYTFNAGAPGGRIAENSGRGLPLVVRTADRGTVRVVTAGTNRYMSFPARCAKGATTCPRALLEGGDDADLDPGTRAFRWGAALRVTKSQIIGSSNVVQKGVVTTESQWKMQLGAKYGKAQCVVVGRGSARAYIARSTNSVADGKWHKVGCRRSGTGLTVTVDGVVRGRATLPSGLTISNDKPLRIGGPNFNTTSDMFHGSLDEVYAALG